MLCTGESEEEGEEAGEDEQEHVDKHVDDNDHYHAVESGRRRRDQDDFHR